MDTYPIKLSHHVKHYAFGTALIPRMLGKNENTENTVAETWEVSDYRDTTGRVINGLYSGRTLHDLVSDFPEELVGKDWSGPHFPLLVKFLDASRMLPVHLHADDEIARIKYGEPNGKTEAWHILWASEEATILAGIKDGIGKEELFNALRSQDFDSVMLRYSVSAGDTVYVPGGVLHSFGPDILILEAQQTSDLGQSVMPEDLYGEPLDEATWKSNIEHTIEELRIDYQPIPNPGLIIENAENRRTICCAGPYFALERWKLTVPHTVYTYSRSFLVLANVGEKPVSVTYPEGNETLERGETCLLPAAIEESTLVPDSDGDLVVCYLPDLMLDVIEPLREMGHLDEEIRNLGSFTIR